VGVVHFRGGGSRTGFAGLGAHNAGTFGAGLAGYGLSSQSRK